MARRHRCNIKGLCCSSVKASMFHVSPGKLLRPNNAEWGLLYFLIHCCSIGCVILLQVSTDLFFITLVGETTSRLGKSWWEISFPTILCDGQFCSSQNKPRPPNIKHITNIRKKQKTKNKKRQRQRVSFTNDSNNNIWALSGSSTCQGRQTGHAHHNTRVEKQPLPWSKDKLVKAPWFRCNTTNSQVINQYNVLTVSDYTKLSDHYSNLLRF